MNQILIIIQKYEKTLKDVCDQECIKIGLDLVSLKKI